MTVYYHIAELDILYSGDSSSAVWDVTAEEGQHSASIRGRSCRLPFCSLGNRLNSTHVMSSDALPCLVFVYDRDRPSGGV